MKRKRLLFAVALVTGMLGWNSAQAQEDITSDYLTNANLSTVDNGWTYYSDAFKYTDWKTDGDVPVVEFYSQWNAGASVAITQKDFKFSQTITLPAGDYRIAVNAFYRNGAGDGTNDNKAWIFAGDKKQNVYALTSAGVSSYTGSNDLYKAANAFSRGDFSNAFDFSLEEEQEIELGFQGFFNTSLSWCILGPVKLYKYSLDDYLVDYRTKVAEAEALYDSPMNGDVLSALQAAVVEESTFNLSSEVTAAIQTLTTAINNANASIAKYVAAQNTINETSAVIAKLDAAGQAAGNAELNTIQTAYNDRSLVEFTNAQANAIIVTAVKSQTTEGADMTLAIVNPSFENGFASGWTNNGMEIQNNTSFEKDGNNYAEKWQPNGTFSVKQSITLLSAGVYQITAKTKARGVTSAKLFANGVEKSITVGDVTNTTVVEFACDANSTFEFGFEGVGTGAGSSWLCVDDFHLQFVGGLPEVAAVEGKMNADVATAQSNAISTYNGNKTVANYNAASAAIAAAKASVNAYTSAAAAIADAKAIQENHNFATAKAVTTFAEAIAAIETPYNDNSLTTEAAAAAGTTLGVAISTWHANPNAAAVNYMENGFGLTDFETALYVNTWSNEGENDGSNFKVPFYEYYTGNENSLGENTWTGTLTGLENGLYKVSAWVRVQAKTGAEAADATGITMNVNGGEAKDVTEGDVVGQFQLATYEAEGLVKDGTLKVNFNIAADNNIHWLSFKNVKYTKVRDLTEEEMAVIPTAIALYNGETEVTEAIELTATANTVTLTPVFTPEDATETVTWTSSDETVATVADGVVTGVAPGTATITVTSTLDETVSATATVNVSYPESTVPETTFINNGPTRTVYTLGENIIKNGSFEYPNPVYGWTTGTGSVNPMSTSNFNIPTTGAGDGNQYLQAKASAGGGEAKSINTSWAIEEGKTYVFGYKIKANKQCTTDLQYIGVSLSNNKGSENSNKKFDTPEYGTEWTDVTYTFTNSDNYKFLVFNARWMANEQSFDNFYLCEATTTTEGNVDYATAAIPTSNIGDGAFQYSQNAIEVANALVQGEASVEDVENAYEALTTLNAPEEGKLYNVVNITEGFSYNGNALTFKSASNADLTKNTTTMGWTDKPGSIYPQGVKFTAVEGVKNRYTMSYTRADGNVVYVSTGKTSGLGDNTQQIRPTTDASKALTFEVISTGDNKWNLMNTEDGHSVGSNGDTGFYTAGGSNKDVKIQEAVNNEVTLKPSAANKYGTLILPFDAEAPENVTIYSVGAIEGTSIALNEETSFAANTPYIVYYGAEINETVGGIGSAYTDKLYTSTSTSTSGYLTGVYSQISLEAGTDGVNNYVLQTNQTTGKQAFYIVGEDAITIPANRAYLTNESNSNGVKAFNLGVDDATAINALDALTSGAYEGIYTVDGVKLNRIEKGVNILKMADGTTRKVIVK